MSRSTTTLMRNDDQMLVVDVVRHRAWGWLSLVIGAAAAASFISLVRQQMGVTVLGLCATVGLSLYGVLSRRSHSRLTFTHDDGVVRVQRLQGERVVSSKDIAYRDVEFEQALQHDRSLALRMRVDEHQMILGWATDFAPFLRRVQKHRQGQTLAPDVDQPMLLTDGSAGHQGSSVAVPLFVDVDVER